MRLHVRRYILRLSECGAAGDGAVHGVRGRAAGRGGRKPCGGLAGQGLRHLPRHRPGAPLPGAGSRPGCRTCRYFGRKLPWGTGIISLPHHPGTASWALMRDTKEIGTVRGHTLTATVVAKFVAEHGVTGVLAEQPSVKRRIAWLFI